MDNKGNACLGDDISKTLRFNPNKKDAELCGIGIETREEMNNFKKKGLRGLKLTTPIC